MRERREWLADGLLGVILAAPVLANQAMRGNALGCAGALVASVAATVLARRWPLAGWLIVVLATVLDGNFAFGIPVLSYLVGLRTERIRPVAGAFAVVAAAGSAFNLAVLEVGPAEWFELAMFLLVLGVFPWLAGRYQAQRRRLVTAGWERAARLESERRMVVLRERARIAHEMHDSLGHELSLIALGAGALETSPDVPEPQRAAATRIRESAATATDQLREIIGVLRDETEAAPLDPVDAPVESLVDNAERAGMTVTMTRTGGEPPAAVERTAYRVVREALTNASRHATGTPVTVDLIHGPDRTTISVTNPPDPINQKHSEGGAGAGGASAGGAGAGKAGTGAAGGGGAAAPGSGTGLVGLRERVRLNGGTLTAGPGPDGGFRLEAEIPHQAAPAAPEAAATEMKRRVRRSLAAAVLTPAALALVTAVAYYPFAANGSVLDSDAFDRMTVGTPRAALDLPGRQAWVRDREAGCEYYSDGNFPLADASYRLCFADGRLIRKDTLQ
ncbi:histidine kinase [Actinoplanes sp. NPDC049596]|uniref:sensor histidine kinase n=1 Tax=unclassified Actinoplanes TaxID=2626549 RepID=UPI0034175017